MKINYLKTVLIIAFTAMTTLVKAQEVTQKADAENITKAREWVSSLALKNPEKEARLTDVIALHLTQIRDWHNSHPYTLVPAGINPLDGKPLSELFRQMIVDSSIPASVHQNLMDGLRKDLTEAQVNTILDKYTIGKVDFTMKGYEAIVPNLTETEAKTIRALLEKAREQAVDYKSMKQISAIFEIYKTQAEQYLNNNGRNWRQMYSDYVKKIKAQKNK
ncbi:DUF3826 domain-containing protein [Pelobium manganitolerans]|uniref:DUF3826 domain-containing protein n=1 Tax=Pelobium manganitolerans TaxID=1842495 RepID=UPI003FA34CFA